MQGGLRVGQIILDTTTGEPAQTAALGERLGARGVCYLDAPISDPARRAYPARAGSETSAPFRCD